MSALKDIADKARRKPQTSNDVAWPGQPVDDGTPLGDTDQHSDVPSPPAQSGDSGGGSADGGGSVE